MSAWPTAPSSALIPIPFYLTRTDGYAITHTVFYLTDFGHRPLPPAVRQPHLRQLLEEAICWTVLGSDLDLLGELLLSAWQLDKAFGPYAQLGLAYLFTAWQRLGQLVAPSFEPAHFATLANDERAAYQFLHTYHTYYVGGPLCAALCESDYAYALPPRPSPAPATSGHSLQQLAAEAFPNNTLLLPVVQSSALSAADQNSFLLDILLIHAIREYDLRLLARLYEVVQQYQLPPRTCCIAPSAT